MKPLRIVSALILATLLVPPPLKARPSAIPIIDLHVDLPYRSLFKGKRFSRGSGEFVAEALLDAGVRGVILPLFVPADVRPSGRNREQLERSYAHVFRSILSTPPYSLPGCSVTRAAGEVRGLSTWLAFEGAGPIGGDPKELAKWALRGVRSFGLVHSVSNSLAGSSGKGPGRPRRAPGLSDEGRRFVRGVAQVGGVVDVSHASDAATDEAIELSLRLKRPLMATHSNARALAPHPRNLTDEQIRGISRSGGIVGVNFHQPFLASRVGGRASIRDVVGQIRYLAKVGGIDSVAIGSDFEGGIRSASGLSDARTYQRLAKALHDEGMKETEIRKVFFKNALRVLCDSR